MAGEPLVAFGAVLRDRADQEHHLGDQFGAGAGVEQGGEAAGLGVPLGAVGQRQAGVGDRGGCRPQPVRVVLDDRDPGVRRTLRRAVMDADPGHYPGQVRLGEVFAASDGGLGAPARPAQRRSDQVRD